MDRAIHDTSKNQERMDHYKPPNVGEHGTSLYIPHRVLPIYHPGDVVKGQINLKVKDALKADILSINLLGECVVNVRLRNKFGPYDETQREPYINKTSVIWQKVYPGTSTSEEVSSLLGESATSDGVLSKGIYMYPYKFTIPRTTSSSIPNLCPGKANYCYVIYRLKAKLTSGKGLGKREVVTHKGLWVDKTQDIALLPDFDIPIVAEETLDTGFLLKTSKIGVKCTIPRKAYARRASIPIKLEIDNNTTLKLDKITAFVCLQGLFRLSDSAVALQKEIEVPGKKTSTLDLAPGSITLDWQLPWDFSESSVDGNLVPAGPLDVCKLIDVKYFVNVKVKRKGLHRNLELQIPIYIGN